MMDFRKMMTKVSHGLGRPTKDDQGALAVAVKDLIGAIAGAKKKGIQKEFRIFGSVAVVLDSLQMHREALYAAVDLVNYLESTSDIHAIPKLISEFKGKALKARIHQHVPLEAPEEVGGNA